MEVFKYTLDKGTKKFPCPNCTKRTLVKYVETETGSYLPDEFGRCDREQNCSYHKAPPKGKKGYLIKVLSLRDISDKACHLTDEFGIISIVPKSQILEQSKSDCYISEWFLKNSIIPFVTNEFKYFYSNISNFANEVKEAVQPQQVKCSFHSLELLDNMYNDTQTDHLTEFLKMRFSKDEVFIATQNYFITGTNICWFYSTVFWQIDDKEQIHAGKIMQYDRFTGKRVKEPYNHVNWLHKAFKEPEFNLSQCLFGLHRINEDYQKTIAIVESEKTAIVMSILLPHYIWLATGSKGNFKFEMLKPIKKRKVVSYPDKGEYSNWLDKSIELNAIGFKISVSDLIEQTDFENGYDLADYYLNL
tara:strand:- start:425 stop:1504 length:1080 start_codon:yes stop_codon:yes gene_type:complete